MTEPTSASSLSLIAAGVGLAAIVPGIDGNALLGAFAGGTLFVVSATALPLWHRFAYLVVSVIAGYMGAQDLMAALPFVKSSGLAAFIVAAVAVTVMLEVIKKARKLDFRFNRRGGPPNA